MRPLLRFMRRYPLRLGASAGIAAVFLCSMWARFAWTNTTTLAVLLDSSVLYLLLDLEGNKNASELQHMGFDEAGFSQPLGESSFAFSVAWEPWVSGVGTRFVTMAVPVVYVILLVLLVAWIPALCGFLVSRSRHRNGRCTGCSYDLDGFAVCPECGQETRPASQPFASKSSCQ